MGLFIVGAGGGCFSEAGFDHGSSGLRGFFTFEIARRWRSESEPYFKPSHFPRARVEPLLPHSRHRQAPALPYFPSICGIRISHRYGINISHHGPIMAAAAFLPYN